MRVFLSLSNKIGGLVFLIFMTACASLPPPIVKNTAFTNNEILNVVFPEQDNQKTISEKLGRLTNYYNKWGRSQYIKEVSEIKIGEKNCFVQQYKAFFYSSGGIGEMQRLKYLCKAKELSNNSVNLIFNTEVSELGHNSMTGEIAEHGLNFSMKDAKKVLKENLKYKFHFELDSKYGIESIYSNFSRMVTEAKRTTKRERFWVKAGDKIVPINVKIIPYRDGSKTIVSAEILATIEGDVLNYDITYQQVAANIERIVNL